MLWSWDLGMPIQEAGGDCPACGGGAVQQLLVPSPPHPVASRCALIL